MVAEQVPGGAISVGLVIIGAILALIGSIAVELIRAWNSDRRERALLIHTLKAELPLIVFTLETLVGRAWMLDPLGVPDRHLSTLEEARSRLGRHWDRMVLLKRDYLSRDLIHFLIGIDHMCH